MSATADKRPLRLRRLLLTANLLLAIAPALPAFAQEAPGETRPAGTDSNTAPAPAPAPGNEIIVTGTHLGASGFTAPTPVTVMDASRIANTAATTVGEALEQLPAYRPTTTPTTQNIFPANAGARIADLRGLGAARTLVLVNSQRFTPSTSAGTVDLNLIPTLLVNRAEIVTGGASAAYGSDAVSGVVNILLDTRLQGIKANAGYGVTDRGDGQNYFAQFAAGTSFGDDRGHVIFGAEYNKDEGTGGCYTRTFCSNEVGDVTGTPGQDGRPAHNISFDVRTAGLTPGGLITGTVNAAGQRAPARGSPLGGIQFDPNGQPTAFTYGQYPGTLFMQGGSGKGLNYFFGDPALSIPVERYNALTHLEYEFSPALTAYVEGSYGHVKGSTSGPEIRDIGFPAAGDLIKVDNPFLPASIRDTMVANGLSAIVLGKLGRDFGTIDSTSTRDTYRVIGGVKGDLGGSWSWDASAQYGWTDARQDVINNRITANFNKAIDVVSGPAGPVCRVNADADPTNNDPACVPLDIIGQNQWSSAAKAYSFGNSWQDSRYKLAAATANIKGQPFETWAGPVAVAAGAEVRDNSLRIAVDPISASNGFYVFNQTPSQGSVSVLEGYAEVAVPLLRDSPLGKKLELNGAIRQTHYKNKSGSTTGTFDATTWKVGVTYNPVDWLLLRATKSRDIRAPNTSELFTTPVAGLSAVTDPQTNTQVFVRTLNGGNIKLRPEQANTFTAGFTVTPGGSLRGFRFSSDYYNISVDDAIATLGAQNIINSCFTDKDPEICALITRNSSGILDTVANLSLNLNKQQLKGIDFEGAYNTPLGADSSLGLNVLAAHTLNFTNSSQPGVDRAGDNSASGIPSWVVDATADFRFGKFGLNLQGHFLSAGKYDASLVGPEDPAYSVLLPNSVNTNRVPSRFYTNVGVTYDVIDNGARKIELYANVYNLFDVMPPPYWNGNNNTVYYDAVGRRYRVGVRVAY